MCCCNADRRLSVTPILGQCKCKQCRFSVIVMIINRAYLPVVFSKIISEAFDFKAIFGAFAGSAMMQGIRRGLYSNEAGIGSAPNASASAQVSHPIKQGLVQMLSVFIDTLLLCTATAMMCLSSGIAPAQELQGAPWVQAALHESLGNFGINNFGRKAAQGEYLLLLNNDVEVPKKSNKVLRSTCMC